MPNAVALVTLVFGKQLLNNTTQQSSESQRKVPFTIFTFYLLMIKLDSAISLKMLYYATYDKG